MARAAENKLNPASKTLYVAFELSQKNWRLACSDGDRTVEASVPARAVDRALAQIRFAQRRLGITGEVVTCYEAGRDGFWLHRALADKGIENWVLDAASIEVDRRARRAKTDRLDARKLVALLIRATRGDTSVRRVNVPTAEVEGARRLERELQRLTRERTAHTNRVRALLALIGRCVKQIRKVPGLLESGWSGADGRPIHPALRDELIHEIARLELVDKQIREAKRAQRAQLTTDAPCAKVTMELAKLDGVGVESAAVLSNELLGWRDFMNRREVASAAGFAPTPYSSGNDQREQGISKAGNARVRWVMIQLAWSWLRLQPNTRLTRWYLSRFASGSKRLRRIGIVALARRLLVDLWRYTKFGVIPDGATLNLDKAIMKLH